MDYSKILLSVGKTLFAIISAILTLTAAFEIVSAKRYAPYLSATIDYCQSHESMRHTITDIRHLVLSNKQSLIYLNLIFVDQCDKEPKDISKPINLDSGQYGSISLITNDTKLELTATPTDLDRDKTGLNNDVVITLVRSRLADSVLSGIRPTELDVGVEKVTGLFYVNSAIDAGVYTIELLPVPFSDALLRKRDCSESLSWAENVFSRFASYVKTCIFESPYDAWADH